MEEKFDVTGMTCAACQANVTRVVSKLDGVSHCDVSLLSNSMKVEFDQDRVNEQTICEAVKQLGYGASVHGQKTAVRKEWQDRQNRVESDQRSAKQRLILSLVLLVPLLLIAMGPMVGVPILEGMEWMMVSALTQLILCLFILFIQRYFFITGFKALIKKSANMDSLVAMGSGASFVYGLVGIYQMAYYFGAQNMEMAHMAMHSLYFESAATIVTLVSVGKYLESRSKAKTSDALDKLVDLAPKNATILRDGKEIVVSSESIRIHDIVVIRPGQRIPVDGKVISGTGYVDQSAITGESLPVEKNVGDSVISATMNENGTFQFEAEKVGEDTTLAKIIRLVDDAGNSKAPIARLADKVSGVFVPVVIVIALITLIAWLISGQTIQFALSNAISVLVISCPCALGLATPVAIMVGTGKAAENGILIKSAAILEQLHSIDTIVLDKTGTITSGKPSVQGIKVYTNISMNDFISMAASLESGSLHPLGQAIVEYAKDKNINLQQPENFTNISGRGIQAKLNGHAYLAGNKRLLEEKNIRINQNVLSDLDAYASLGQTPLIFVEDQNVIGLISVADTIRSTSQVALEQFKKKNMHVVMLTGDNQKTANAIGKSLSVDEVISDVLPQDKESVIRKLQEQGKKVMMVGDGINDAPALMRADIGVAIGGGTDIALDSADVILMKSSLLDVVTAIDLSNDVIKNIKMNLFWAFFYNILGIPVAAGLLYPAFGIRLSPMIGSACMSLSSVCVVTNALRLRYFKPKVQSEEVKTYTMHIDGMSCGHCAWLVEDALKKVLNVKEVRVDYNLGKADIDYVQQVNKVALRQAVKDAGYIPVEYKEEKKMEKVVTVDGMMCMHCVAHVKDALSKVEGVSDVVVSLDEKTATLNCTENVTDQMLSDAVTNAGYTVISVK